MINIKQVLQFVQNHWALCSIFVAILALLVFEELKNKIGGIAKITALDATILLNRENAVAVDIRNQNAFTCGHILNSINITQAEANLEQYRNHTVILVDNDSASTASVAIGAKLQKQGFTKIYILTGGLQAWKDAHLPLTKK